eukprot:jgi/Botrbrau1/22494/Bobra.114_2s0020.1
MIRRDGKLTADNIKGPMREIRRALLEADVSLPIVRQFVGEGGGSCPGSNGDTRGDPGSAACGSGVQRACGSDGGRAAGPGGPPRWPQIILMAGLQGVGKTTACGKLARLLQQRDKKVLMVATDVYRPAAIEQLVTLGRKLGVDVFEMGTSAKPPDIARFGLQKALKEGYDSVIIDTAGRLQIDENMMKELQKVKEEVNPTDTLLVVDAMTGQEAAALTKAFNEAAPITGAILTKTDGDSRGGAALSVKAVSGKPIKFMGTGEGLDALEPFSPSGMASRILDKGDILAVLEKAEAAVSEEEAKRLADRMARNKFDFNDFLQQYKALSGMGGSMGLSSVMRLLPGMSAVTDKQMAEVEKRFRVFESMINSMTKEEREKPELLARTPSRRRRIARGSGRTDQDVAQLLASFTSIKSQMRTFSSMMGGLMGKPKMTDKELLQDALASASAKVGAGKVRRRKPKAATSARGFGKLASSSAR